MNRENMTKLRDHLVWLKENGKEQKFGMADYIHHPGLPYQVFAWYELRDKLPDETISPYECKAVACLAGFAAMLAGEPPEAQRAQIFEAQAQDWLGLTHNEAQNLFMGYWAGCDANRDDLAKITLEQAIVHLNKVLEDPEKWLSYELDLNEDEE